MTDEDFGALYTALRAQLFGFAVRRLGHDAAKDIVADTFEVAWKKRHEVPEDRALWAAWIVGIAKNKVLQESQRRRRKHHDNRFADDWVDPRDEPRAEDVADVVFTSDAGKRAYAALTPAEQHLLEIAYFQGLRPRQAAELMGISRTAFTTRLGRLRQRIESLLESELRTDRPAGSEERV